MSLSCFLSPFQEFFLSLVPYESALILFFSRNYVRVIPWIRTFRTTILTVQESSPFLKSGVPEIVGTTLASLTFKKDPLKFLRSYHVFSLTNWSEVLCFVLLCCWVNLGFCYPPISEATLGVIHSSKELENALTYVSNNNIVSYLMGGCERDFQRNLQDVRECSDGKTKGFQDEVSSVDSVKSFFDSRDYMLVPSWILCFLCTPLLGSLRSFFRTFRLSFVLDYLVLTTRVLILSWCLGDLLYLALEGLEAVFRNLGETYVVRLVGKEESNWERFQDWSRQKIVFLFSYPLILTSYFLVYSGYFTVGCTSKLLLCLSGISTVSSFSFSSNASNIGLGEHVSSFFEDEQLVLEGVQYPFLEKKLLIPGPVFCMLLRRISVVSILLAVYCGNTLPSTSGLIKYSLGVLIFGVIFGYYGHLKQRFRDGIQEHLLRDEPKNFFRLMFNNLLELSFVSRRSYNGRYLDLFTQNVIRNYDLVPLLVSYYLLTRINFWLGLMVALSGLLLLPFKFYKVGVAQILNLLAFSILFSQDSEKKIQDLIYTLSTQFTWMNMGARLEYLNTFLGSYLSYKTILTVFILVIQLRKLVQTYQNVSRFSWWQNEESITFRTYLIRLLNSYHLKSLTGCCCPTSKVLYEPSTEDVQTMRTRIWELYYRFLTAEDQYTELKEVLRSRTLPKTSTKEARQSLLLTTVSARYVSPYAERKSVLSLGFVVLRIYMNSLVMSLAAYLGFLTSYLLPVLVFQKLVLPFL